MGLGSTLIMAAEIAQVPGNRNDQEKVPAEIYKSFWCHYNYTNLQAPLAKFYWSEKYYIAGTWNISANF